MSLLILLGAMLSAPVPGEELKAPADPVATIEGRWQGQWDDAEVEIKNGVVTVTKSPASKPWIVPGTVVARLNNTGKVDGRAFRFSGSQCINFGASRIPAEWNYIPCGDYSAVLVVSVSTYELSLPLLPMQRAKK